MLWDLSRTDDMALENDIFPRLFPGRNLIVRSSNQGHPARPADNGDTSQGTIGVPHFHRPPECVFRSICISVQPPDRSNGYGRRQSIMRSLTDIVSEGFIWGVGITRPREGQRRLAAYYISGTLAVTVLAGVGLFLLLVSKF